MTTHGAIHACIDERPIIFFVLSRRVGDRSPSNLVYPERPIMENHSFFSILYKQQSPRTTLTPHQRIILAFKRLALLALASIALACLPVAHASQHQISSDIVQFEIRKLRNRFSSSDNNPTSSLVSKPSSPPATPTPQGNPKYSAADIPAGTRLDVCEGFS
jgi:hypothetical protein